MAPDSTPAFRWAVIGPGGIANRFAGALPAVPGARLSAVFARDASKGQAYANQWQREGEAPARVTTVLAEVLGSDEVDAVYIATPTPTTASTCAPRWRPANRCCARSRSSPPMPKARPW